jgi:hypothetical protein
MRAPDEDELTPTEAKVLAFIRCELAAGKPFPDVAAVCGAMGWRDNPQAYHAMMALSGLGYIARWRERRWMFGPLSVPLQRESP